MQAHQFYLLWSQMKETDITFPVNDFTFYLSEKKAQINLNITRYDFAPEISNYENKYNTISLQYFIMIDDFDKIVFLSSGSGFKIQEKCN